MLRTSIVLGSLVLVGLAPVRAEQIEFSQRFQPGQDVITDETVVTVTNSRFSPERGGVTQPKDQPSARPETSTTKTVRTTRHITGKQAQDGSFPLEIRNLGVKELPQDAKSKQEEKSDSAILDGISMLAIVEKNGQIRRGSFQVQFTDPQKTCLPSCNN